MDHEAYENEMINSVNRHAEANDWHTTFASTVPAKKSVFTKTDVRALKQGLKRTLLALLTAALFAIAVLGFIAVATAPGYLAVVLFLASIVATGCAFILVYAQGIIYVGSKGDSK